MATTSQTNQGLITEIGRRLDALSVGPMHRKVVVAIGLGLFFEMYEIFLSSTISTTLKTQYDMDGTTLKLLLASSFVGMFVGAAALGRLADRIGRRRAFLFNLIWFSLWTLVGAFAPTPWFLVVTRFLAGVGVGAEYPVADAYLFVMTSWAIFQKIEVPQNVASFRTRVTARPAVHAALKAEGLTS